MSAKQGYNGNPHLPKSGSTYNYTSEQVKEIQKCIEDPVYFAESYFKIISVDDGLVPFKLYDFQKEVVASYVHESKMILATSRQVGKTSIATAIILHYALFNPFKRIFILANKNSTALEILSRVQRAYEYLPDWLKCGVVEWNKSSVELENGTIIQAAATSSDAIRGQSANMLFIDEQAFVKNWDEFAASVLPTISSGKHSKLIYASTPNGLNHFYDYVQGARKGTNGFKLFEVMWHEVPGRDEAWKKATLEALNHDLQQFAAEYEIEFMGSSGTLVSGSKLKQIISDTVTPTHYDPAYGYSIYEEPKKDHMYTIICDVSRGKGLDYSAFQVIDVTSTPYKQVAKFKNNMITPIDYAMFILNTAKGYNMAYVLIEINDIGGQVSDILVYDFDYENVLHTESAGAKGKRISNGYGSSIDTGIRTTKTVKALGCSMLKLLLEQDKLIIYDKETANELAVFSKKRDSYEAEQGYNDDLVMCLVLFSWFTTDEFFTQLNDGNVLHSLRDLSEDQVMNTLTPFGIIHNAAEEKEEVIVMGGEVWESISSMDSTWGC